MTTKPETPIEREPQLIAMSRLTLSPLNPRQSVTEEEVANMAESLRATGLIQNLAGFVESGDEIGVVAGGRRLRALQLIAQEDKTDPATVMVPVILAADAAEAEAWAGAENLVRAPLHPADEVRAFATMAEGGASETDIAKAFAVTQRHVKGRLKLAVLPELILDALKANEITLDVAAAYTVAKTPERALEVFEAIKDSRISDHAPTIRRCIVGDAADETDRLVKLVGREAYEAEGGTVNEDLFGEQVFFEDVELLTRLAEARIAEAAQAVKVEGWKWIDGTFDEPDWRVTEKMGRTYAEQPEADEVEAERYEELGDKVEYGEATNAEEEEFAALREKLDQEIWTERQKVFAGAFVFIGYNGDLRIRRGYIQPQDIKAAEEAGVCRASQHVRSGSAKPSGPYPAKLMDDLAQVRTCAVQTALLDKPALALDILTFALSQPIYAGSNPVGVSTQDAANAPEADDGLTVHERIAAQPYGRPFDSKGAAKAFAEFRAKPQKDRNAILTESLAKLVRVGMGGNDANPLAEMIAGLAAPDIRKVWTPTASFLKRLKAGQLDAVMQHIDGEQLPSGFAKMKKAEKVERLHRIFAGEKGIPPLTPQQRARADTWLPELIEVAPPKTPAKPKAKPRAKPAPKKAATAA